MLVIAADRWLSLDIPVSSTNKTDRHDITEILIPIRGDEFSGKDNYIK
jgi:hypothetical protein